MKTRNRVLKLIAVVAMVTAGAVWGATSASAALNFTRSTGMFGISQTQTARINLVNLEDGAFVPCVRVEMVFVDGDGSILAQKVYEVDAGKSAFFDLRGSEIIGRGSNRAQIRAEVRFVGTPDTRLSDNCIPTVEIFDNESGETRFLLPAVQKVQKVQPLEQSKNDN
jgi:hypothetical protein